jgi:hypothetical protein
MRLTFDRDQPTPGSLSETTFGVFVDPLDAPWNPAAPIPGRGYGREA